MEKALKALILQALRFFISNFISILVIRLHDGLIFTNIGFCHMGVDPFHGGVVFPAADLHGYFLWHIQVICQRSKAVAESVDSDFRKTGFSAYAVDSIQDCGWVHRGNIR